jgi:ferritin-like metal-binding protein YciE
VTFETPEQAAELLRSLAAAPLRKEELRRAWQAHILSDHTYAARLKTILEGCPIQA